MRFCKILASTINRQNRALGTVFLSFVIVMTSLMVILTSSDAYVSSLTEARKSVFGGFSHISYQYEPVSENILEELSWIVVSKNEDKQYSVGAMNSSAAALSYCGINTYELPKESEVILTEGIKKRLFSDFEIGDNIRLENREYRITKIIPDYGFLWVKGDKEIQNKVSPPEIILHNNDYEDIVSKEGYYGQTWILMTSNPAALFDIMIQSEIVFTANSNIELNNEKSLFGLHGFLMRIILALCFLLIFSLLRDYEHRSTKKYSILGNLGLTSSELKIYLLIESVVIMLLAVVTSSILSYLISTMLLSFTVLDQELQIFYSFVGAGIKVYGSSLVALLFSFLPIRFDMVKNSEKCFRQNNLRRLFFHDMSCIKSPLIMFGLFVFFLSTMFGYIFMEYQFTVSLIEPVDAQGRMARDYDIQLKIDKGVIPPGYALINGQLIDNSTKQIVYWGDISGEERISSETLGVIDQQDEILDIHYYKENYSNLYTIIDSEIKDSPYVSPRFEVDLLDIDYIFSNVAQGLFGIRSRFISYPEKDLEAFKKFFEDDVNWEDFLAGKSVLLVAPSYSFWEERKIMEDGAEQIIRYWELTKKPIQKENAQFVQVPDFYKKGSKVLLCLLSSEYQISGALTAENMKNYVNVIEIPTVVAGVTDFNIGWFDNSLAPPSAFSYIVSDNFLKNNRLNIPISRVNIYAKPNIKSSELFRLVSTALSNRGGVVIENRREMLGTLQAYRLLETVYRWLLLLTYTMIMIAISVSLVGVTLSRLELRSKMYRMFGMSAKRQTIRHLSPYFIVFLSTVGATFWFAEQIAVKFVAVGESYIWGMSNFTINAIFFECVSFIIFTFVLVASLRRKKNWI